MARDLATGNLIVGGWIGTQNVTIRGDVYLQGGPAKSTPVLVTFDSLGYAIWARSYPSAAGADIRRESAG